MNKLKTPFFIALVLLMSCSNDSKTIEKKSNETEAIADEMQENLVDIDDFATSSNLERFDFLNYLRLGSSFDEGKIHLKNFTDISNLKEIKGSGLENSWTDEMGINHYLTLGSYISETIEYILYRIDFTTEETKLSTWDYYSDLEASLLNTYGKPTAMTKEGRNGETVWDNEDILAILNIGDDFIVLNLEYSYPDDSEAFIDEPEGEWVQVGEDGRMVFMPKE